MDFDFSLAPPQLIDIDNPQVFFDAIWLSCRQLINENSDLKENLSINSQNSSLPPSTVAPFKRKKPTPAQKKWWQKKPGAVLGHKGYGRRLLTLDHVHEVITCLPKSGCSHCGALVNTLKSYSRKQLLDLPLGKLQVTEYQLYRGRCVSCKKRSSAQMPDGVPQHLLGPNALARICLITEKYHLSKRLTSQLLLDLFGLKLSIGTISNAEAKVTRALKKSIEDIENEVEASQRLHADETSFFMKNKLQWLWVASSEQARLFKIFAKRDTASAKQLIGEDYAGFVNTDRFGSYNWFWGKSATNILTLAMAYEGVAIPILWETLDKTGNATASEHQAIIQRFINLFGVKRIAGVLADREFASGNLFQWFNEQKISFYIRIKEDSNVKTGGKKLCKAVDIFDDLPSNNSHYFNMNIELYGQSVYLGGSRADDGELMIVATNQCPKNAITVYLRRWEVESLFSCLKGRGFRFEDTHITKPERVSKIMGLLAVGFCWLHKVGEWQDTIKPIKFKHFRHGVRPQYSLFRYGFNFIRNLLLGPDKNPSLFRRCLNLLRSPPLLDLEISS